MQRLRSRLQDLAGSVELRGRPQALRAAAASQVPILDRHLRRFAWVRRCERVLAQAGLRWTVANVVLASLVLALGCMVVLGIAVPASAHAGPLRRACWPAPLPWLEVLRRREQAAGAFRRAAARGAGPDRSRAACRPCVQRLPQDGRGGIARTDRRRTARPSMTRSPTASRCSRPSTTCRSGCRAPTCATSPWRCWCSANPAAT